MRIRSTIVMLVTAVAGLSVLTAPAAALEPGVFVDPGSPAGKEYSFPLAVLRAAAGGHAAPQGATEPLFGAGIAPASRSRQRSAHGAREHSLGRKSRHGAAPSRTSGPGSRAAQSRSLARLVRASSPAPQVALITILVVLGGLALGAVLVTLGRRGG
jgi:hypothetical protein